MSENKFLERLRGTGAKRSVLEIKNQNTITTFANMPNGASNPNIAFSDHRGNAATPLRGTDNWQITSQNVLADAGTIYGDGRDITTEFNVSGNTLWIDAGYTFTAPKLFTPNTKFVLKLCGHGMFSTVEKHIKFVFLVKFSNGYLITKDVIVRPEAFDFSKEFVIDFDNSEANVIKMVPGDKMTVQLLCADGNAYATIYGGMTVFTALQRRVNSEAVASETLTFEEVANAIGDLQTAVDGKVDRVGDTMTGPLKFKSGSFSGAISGYFNGISFYKLDANDNVILIGSFRDTDLTARNTGTADLGTSSIKWRTLYALKLNNGADLAIPTLGGTLARIEDVPVDISDLSDVQTSSPQVGDYLRWNGQYWYNASGGSGATVEWGLITGDIADQADLQSALAGKADTTDLANKANVDMDNLTDTGKNIANWSSNVTNCITEIPQDIIIDFDGANRTATLKAGSKIYVPAGLDGNNDPVYNQLIINADMALNPGAAMWNNEPHITVVKSDGTVNAPYATRDVYSGDTAPNTPYQNAIWYDTSANLIKITSDYGSTWSTDTYSFPICLYKETGGSFDSLDQVFNGFGYIGASLFVLPGIKGLIANGRNPDGTVKSTQFTTSSVITTTRTWNTQSNQVFVLFDNNVCWIANRYIVSETMPTVNSYTVWYQPSTNVMHINNTGSSVSWMPVANCVFITDIGSGGNISLFNPKEVFRAVDTNDLTTLLGMIYPVGSIYIGTQKTCPLATLIPGSTWQLVATDRALWGGNGSNANTTIAAGLPNIYANLNCGNTINSAWVFDWANGAFTVGGGNSVYMAGSSGAGNNGKLQASFVASNSNSIYGSSSTVQPPAYRVNVWRRTA